MCFFRRNSNKRTKSTSYRKQFSNCLKMVHVGLYSVGTHHKKFGRENKKNKNVLCRVSRDDTRQRSLCRVSTGWHSAKYREIIFAECHPGDTRQRGLCRVPDRGHSAKKRHFTVRRLSFSSITLTHNTHRCRLPARSHPPPPPHR
jgi:hypothetical protein